MIERAGKELYRMEIHFSNPYSSIFVTGKNKGCVEVVLYNLEKWIMHQLILSGNSSTKCTELDLEFSKMYSSDLKVVMF